MSMFLNLFAALSQFPAVWILVGPEITKKNTLLIVKLPFHLLWKVIKRSPRIFPDLTAYKFENINILEMFSMEPRSATMATPSRSCRRLDERLTGAGSIVRWKTCPRRRSSRGKRVWTGWERWRMTCLVARRSRGKRRRCSHRFVNAFGKIRLHMRF